VALHYTTRDYHGMKQKECERKRSAASCQQLDIHFQKKSKEVEEEVIKIDADSSASDDDGSADELLTDSGHSLPSAAGNIAS